MPPRFSFKSNVKYDIALLTETESVNPFAFKVQKPQWVEVAKNLQKCDLQMNVNNRNCHDRVVLLLKEFNGDENFSRKASGIAESEMSELKLLLTRVKELATEGTGAAKNLYNNRDKQEAEKTRSGALENLHEEDSPEEISDESGDASEIVPENVEDDEDLPVAKKARRAKKGDAILYLQKKHETDTDLRKQELTIRKMEVENRLLELNLAKEKQDMDFKLKQTELEILRQGQEAQSQEKSVLTKALLELISTRTTN